jgi:ubiquitin-like 1-activating enzyme E1 B
MNYKVTQLLYGDAYHNIKNLSILVVGVGGIGCEILKCICKMPLKQIDILDLDTIEVIIIFIKTSNLNRQFLFKQCHRGQSKALTAK